MGSQEQTRSAQLGAASAEWTGEELTVRSGGFERRWRWTGCGLATCFLRDGGRTWVDSPADANHCCDWHLFRLVRGESEAQLKSVCVTAVEDPPVTSDHVLAVADIVYPAVEMTVRYAVQVFGDAAGVRTQLAVRALRPFEREEIPSFLLESYAEFLPVSPAEFERQAVGYYNDLQHRNHDHTPIMRTERRTGALAEETREIYDWANLLTLAGDDGGLILVKESHKCVNQEGIETGAFVLAPSDVHVTGLGLKANNYARVASWLPHDGYRRAWANWCVPYAGGEPEKQLALKRFDRARFRPDPVRDARSKSNTWGTRYPGEKSRAAAEQQNVLKEIASCADLGIDAVAIDDGWQWPPDGLTRPERQDWRPDPERFPNGWLRVRRAAEEAGVDLHLWLPGAQATLEQIIRNIEEGGFTELKIDFLNFPTRDALESVVEKIARLVRHTGYRLRISWDVTENAPRLGYFFGREFGSLHVANRKPTYETHRVHHIAYTPRLVLRDMWQLAHYVNLGHVEIPVQDVDRLDPAISNASDYSHAYCTAMSVVGLPLFFQETHFLQGKARDQVRTVMRTWRKHRLKMASGYVFAIGDEPCDAAWTGFQCHIPESGEGYVLVFRELHASEQQADLPLHFVNQPLAWHNVLDGERWTDEAGGSLRCEIEERPGFRWLHYAARK